MMKKILLVFLLISLSVTAFAQDGMDENVLLDILESYIDTDGAGMVVYVMDNGMSASAAAGIANIETGERITTDDLFRIGSTTKPMVATLVLVLVDEGLLDLDDPIADYIAADIIDSIPNAEDTTVRQMLQMTSGIFNYTESDAFNDAVFDDPSYAWTAAAALEFAYDEPAYFDVGDDYYYSNTNYLLAELLIEDVSGMSLSDALATMFDSLDMDSCFLETPDRFADGIVQGYALDDDDQFYNMTMENDGVGMGDGGVICNAEDLAKFPVGLWNGDLISDDLLDEMLDTVSDGEGGEYGLGIGYDDGDFGMALSHDGATSGFQSTMYYLPEEGIVVSILTNNFDSEVVEDVVYDVLDEAFSGG